MIIFKKAVALQTFLAKKKDEGAKIGFAPTMGALHNGHVSLIRESKKQDTISVASIFVNPTQFNDQRDFEKYPVTLEKDILLFETEGCDVLFVPGIDEIYPEGTRNLRHYDLGFLDTVLEGKFRPGHFQGVCQVVHRLLEIVDPDNLYLGQKDYQQCMVIKKLIDITGQSNIKANICPTLREQDGLAMSSRNARLAPGDRLNAATISRALRYIKENIEPGSLRSLKEKARTMLQQNELKPDYIEIADAGTLQLIDDWDGQKKMVTLAAAYLNGVRLIDNMVINT